MKRNALIIASMFLFALLISSNSFAQSGDDYARNTTTAPDVTANGWTRDSAKDVVEGVLVQEFYVNNSQGLMAYVQVRNRNGLREELFMTFGSKNVVRAALKVDGRWYVGKAPFYDYSNKNPENDFKFDQIKDSQGKVTGIKVILDTVEGLKSVIVDVR